MRLSESIPVAEISGQKIVADYLNGDKKLAPFFAPLPNDTNAFSKFSAPLQPSAEERKKISRILIDYQTPLGASAATLKNTEKLADIKAFAIVSGQQPAFLLGPIFNLLKAATAVRLARDLSAKGFPAIPVFWNHSEDHDLEETNHLFLPNANSELQKFRLPYATEKKFLHDTVLDSKAVDLFESVRGNLSQSEFLKDCDELFRPREGNTLSQEFTRILLKLFGKDGLVVVEPQLIRETSSLALVELLRLSPDFEPTLAENREKLRQLGYTPTIAEDQALFFERHRDQRVRVTREKNLWVLPSGKKLNSEEFAAEIEKDPKRFSPGALLRALTQCRALPVAAYVGGPTELAYSAENFALFPRLKLQTPMMLPRFSASFVEPSIQKLLEKFQLRVKDVLVPEKELEKKFSSPEPKTAADLAKLREQAATALKQIEAEVRGLDASLLGPLSKTQESVSSSLQKFEEKVRNASRNQAGVGSRQMKKLSTLLYPQEKLQERVISPLHFFSRHGLKFVDDLLSVINPFDFNHRVVQIESET